MRELNGHKNIVRYKAHSIKRQQNNGVYEVLLLLEYCSRGHVLDLMNKKIQTGFTQKEVLNIFSDVCKARGEYISCDQFYNFNGRKWAEIVCWKQEQTIAKTCTFFESFQTKVLQTEKSRSFDKFDQHLGQYNKWSIT